MKILIADDHPVVRQGIRQIVAAGKDIEIVGEAANGSDLLEQARRTAPDLVLLDLSMPGIGGLDALKQLKHERHDVAVIVLTVHSEDQFAIRALKAGADGFLTKESAPEELLDAIQKVASGERYISPLLAVRLAGHLGPEGDKPLHERLSDREYQVLMMMAAGLSTHEISGHLSLSIKTVGTYRSRLLTKMGMKNAAELTAYVIRNRLAD